MKSKRRVLYIIVLGILFITPFKNVKAQHIWPEDADRYTDPIPGQEAIGHWDITISNGGASWLEIAKSGSKSLVGQFVGQGGSARPISEINYDEKSRTYSFTIPPQWGTEEDHLEFQLKNDKLSGYIISGKGQELSWEAYRAPELKTAQQLEWDEPIDLLKNGLSDWKDTTGWKIDNGILKLAAKGSEDNRNEGGDKNIKTRENFDDFKMHVEFRYGEGANSGIYLRGRYELQILDSYGMKAEAHGLGGIYGFISPSKNFAKKPGQWQMLNITLVGRMVTVELNGEKIIVNRPIPGITGGAIDSKEEKPGPIMIQGDHYGKLEFRNMSIMPAK